jgi:hypothetical protein
MSAILLFGLAWLLTLLFAALFMVALDVWITVRREAMRKLRGEAK